MTSLYICVILLVLFKLLVYNKIYIIESYFFFLDIPKPHKFVKLSLESTFDLSSIITDINELLPQLSDFINNFNKVVVENDINVITDSAGNMSIDFPAKTSDSDANKLTARVGVIDRLIGTQDQKISDLLKEGLIIEEKLKEEDPKYISQLSEQKTELKKLKSSYKH